jgi:hypothetical protein
MTCTGVLSIFSFTLIHVETKASLMISLAHNHIVAMPNNSKQVAKFAPAFFKVQYEKSTNKLAVGASCYLKKTNGQPINGLPNFKGRDLPAFGGICSGKQLAYSQSGLDTEGIQVIPGRKHVAIVDEYAPSIVIARSFNYGSSCGQIVARYVPTDSKLSSAEAGYPIIKVLPAILSQRREDRSFGALSVSSNGKYLLASNQGPMVSSGFVQLLRG